MLRCALLVWAAVRCSGSASSGSGAIGRSAAVESADPEFVYKPGENLFKRSTRGLGISVLLQYFSYLPISRSTDQPEEWKDDPSKFEDLKKYVDKVLWSKTSQGGAIVTMHDLAELFQNPDAMEYVEHLAGKDYKGDQAGEHKAQTEVLTRMLREADKADISGKPFGVAYFQGQESKIDGTFAIIVDESAKRVVVAFRGSQTATDWVNNLSPFPGAKLRINGEVERFDGKTITVHRGFRNVLFKQDKKTGRVIFDQIKDQLHKNFRKGEYSLALTGHSQGGGLATMAGYAFSKDKSILEWMAPDKPVEVFSYASPPIGWGPWHRAFQAAELGGTIRHLRFMGDDDPIQILRGLGNLEHCGARIILNSAGVQDWVIDYPDADHPTRKSKPLSQFYKTDLTTFMHQAPNYLTRVRLAKKILHKFETPTTEKVFADLLNDLKKGDKGGVYKLLDPN